jgi:Holliday junction resolvase-like predicted endonuclease
MSTLTASQALALAQQYLHDRGARILDSAPDGPGGQPVILAADGHVFVTCHVITGTRHSPAPCTLTSPVLRQLRHLATGWLAARRMRFGQLRTDIIAVTSGGPGGCTLEHIKGVN